MQMCWHCTGHQPLGISPRASAPASQSLLLPFPLAQPVLAQELPPPAARSCWFLNFFYIAGPWHRAGPGAGGEPSPSPPSFPCSLSSQLSHGMLEGIPKECLGCRGMNQMGTIDTWICCCTPGQSQLCSAGSEAPLEHQPGAVPA